MTKYIVGAIAFLGFIVLLILNPFVLIDTGERGIVLDFGAFNGKILEPGLKFRVPIQQDIVKMNVQTQKNETGVNAASKDLQSVTATIAVNYNLDPSKVGDLYKKTGKDFEERIIAPAIQEAVKASTAQFTAEELITQRQSVKDKIKGILVERLTRDYIVVEDVAIVDFNFSSSFNQAIEAKVTAEQNALAQKNKLEQVKYEAQQQIETAKAQAEAIKIQASAITSQGGADYVKLQWIKAWEKGGSKVPTFITGEGGANFLMDINQ